MQTQLVVYHTWYSTRTCSVVVHSLKVFHIVSMYLHEDGERGGQSL